MGSLLHQLKWVSATLEAAKLTQNAKMIERYWLIRESLVDAIFNELGET